MADEKIRVHFDDYLSKAEVVIYSVLAALLFITALLTIANAGKMLWEGLGQWTIATQTLLVLDQLLVVLMLVEILHTVRISIRSRGIIIEPFLIVGLIACVRRVLVIAMQAAKLNEAGPDAANVFQRSMIELGVVGFLVLTFVISIYVLRRSANDPDLVKEYEH